MPHPFRFFLRKGWETNEVQDYSISQTVLVPLRRKQGLEHFAYWYRVDLLLGSRLLVAARAGSVGLLAGVSKKRFLFLGAGDRLLRGPRFPSIPPTRHEFVAPASRPAVAWTSRSTPHSTPIGEPLKFSDRLSLYQRWMPHPRRVFALAPDAGCGNPNRTTQTQTVPKSAQNRATNGRLTSILKKNLRLQPGLAQQYRRLQPVIPSTRTPLQKFNAPNADKSAAFLSLQAYTEPVKAPRQAVPYSLVPSPCSLVPVP